MTPSRGGGTFWVLGAHVLPLGLQGLGSLGFPASTTGSGVTWFGEKGVPADVPCPLGCLGHPSGHPLPPQIPPCVSHPQPCCPAPKNAIAVGTPQPLRTCPSGRPRTGTTPNWGHPTQHLTPDELGVVLWPLGTGDTRPANPGMSPATSRGCSRYEGSARTWPRWRVGTLWQGLGTLWDNTHVSQHKMGTCQGFGSVSYSHHISHLVGSSHLAGCSSPSCPAPPAAAPHRIPYVGRRKTEVPSPWWLLCHHHNGDVHLSSLSTPFSEQK